VEAFPEREETVLTTFSVQRIDRTAALFGQYVCQPILNVWQYRQVERLLESTEFGHDPTELYIFVEIDELHLGIQRRLSCTRVTLGGEGYTELGTPSMTLPKRVPSRNSLAQYETEER
jgi:hypothetical protein